MCLHQEAKPTSSSDQNTPFSALSLVQTTAKQQEDYTRRGNQIPGSTCLCQPYLRETSGGMRLAVPAYGNKLAAAAINDAAKTTEFPWQCCVKSQSLCALFWQPALISRDMLQTMVIYHG